MEQHLPVLLIITPLIAAPLCVLARQRALVFGLTFSVCWLTFAMSIMLLVRVLREGVIRYELGGWVPPWGIEYRVDLLSAFVLLFVSGIGAVVVSYAPVSAADEIPTKKHYLFYTEFLLCLAGLLGITITGDLFNVFVFLEISSLSSYALISLGQSRRCLTAAFQYLVMGTIGATFILIGIGLMYMMTGTLNMADMAERLTGTVTVDGREMVVNQTRTVMVAFAFFTVGVSIKMALFPLHLWLPNAYTFAPSVVTALLAATATKVSVYILLRFVFTVFGTEFAFNEELMQIPLMILSLIGIFAASLMAIFQSNIKRMLAFSSVAQIGYIVLGISFVSVSGLTGGVVHLFNHALIKGGLFLAMGCIALNLGSVELSDMRGIGRRMPLTMFAWVIGGLGLIGVPLTAGFVSKWYFISAAMERGWWPVAFAILLSSLLAVVYVWRVVEVAYFQRPSKPHAKVSEAPLAMLIPTYALAGATVYFGIWTGQSAGIASQIAQLLLEGGP